mmetsp:Transcript_10852/g.24557  ORF Transcript_10852/g.24557 Transcript_10852/m.24557 type:complete len:248 (+) Transcript_10852:1439-2182(+)
MMRSSNEAARTVPAVTLVLRSSGLSLTSKSAQRVPEYTSRRFLRYGAVASCTRCSSASSLASKVSSASSSRNLLCFAISSRMSKHHLKWRNLPAKSTTSHSASDAKTRRQPSSLSELSSSVRMDSASNVADGSVQSRMVPKACTYSGIRFVIPSSKWSKQLYEIAPCVMTFMGSQYCKGPRMRKPRRTHRLHHTPAPQNATRPFQSIMNGEKSVQSEDGQMNEQKRLDVVSRKVLFVSIHSCDTRMR